MLAKEILPMSVSVKDSLDKIVFKRTKKTKIKKLKSKNNCPTASGRKEISYFQHLIFKCCVGIFPFSGGVYHELACIIFKS